MKAGFCGTCGEPLTPGANFCRGCGTPTSGVATPGPVPPTVPGSRRVSNRTIAILSVVAVGVIAAITYALMRSDPVAANELGPNGLGPLRIGMSVDDALDTGWVSEDETTRDACGYASLTSRADDGDVDPDDVGLIFLDGELALISASGDSVVGPRGLSVGDTEREVRDALGDAVEERVDDYGSTHLEVIEGGRGLSFIFYDGDRVGLIESGTAGGLGLIEGCA